MSTVGQPSTYMVMCSPSLITAGFHREMEIERSLSDPRWLDHRMLDFLRSYMANPAASRPGT
jgi:hypothetical protein